MCKVRTSHLVLQEIVYDATNFHVSWRSESEKNSFSILSVRLSLSLFVHTITFEIDLRGKKWWSEEYEWLLKINNQIPSSNQTMRDTQNTLE